MKQVVTTLRLWRNTEQMIFFSVLCKVSWKLPHMIRQYYLCNLFPFVFTGTAPYLIGKGWLQKHCRAEKKEQQTNQPKKHNLHQLNNLK